MNIPLLFSVLFLLVASVCILLGIYILYINPKANLNRVFFAVCISLSIWSVGFTYAVNAPDMETCLFWRRIAALGWGTIYSILLHFFMILTEKKAMQKKKLTYILLYIPSAFIIYVFAISGRLAEAQYNLAYLTTGWANTSVNNWLDWLFNIYYISFSVAGLALVWIWGKRSTEEKKKKQANLIVYSVLTAFLLGTVTDIVFNSYLPVSIPQMAPVIILIPVVSIFFAVRRLGLMKKEAVNEGEMILQENTRAIMYNRLSICYILGAFLYFITQFVSVFQNEEISIKSILINSGTFIFMGVIIMLIQRANLNNKAKEYLIIIIVCLSIPYITFLFIEHAAVTIWLFPVVFLLIALLYNNPVGLLAVSITTVVVQIILWRVKPELSVSVDVSIYISRIGLLLVITWIAFHVNKVYIERFNENVRQTRLQKLIAEISGEYIDLSIENLDEKINLTLKKSGELFEVDRSYVFLFDPDNGAMTYTHEWCNDGIKAQKGTIKDISQDVFPWWMSQIKNKGVVHIPDVEKLPEEAAEEKQQLVRQQVKSLISLPIIGSEDVLGFIGFDSVKSKRKWQKDYSELLWIVANILADAIERVQKEKKINDLAYYDQLTRLPNRLLFEDRATQAIHLAKRTGKLIGIIFIDIDSFKTVNDTIGHDGGDELLIEISKRLSKRMRKSDTVGRFGADEFIILAANISEWEDIIKIADSVMGLFAKPFSIRNNEFFITVSTGVAVFPVDGEDIDALMKNAATAMHTVKEDGKNKYVLCTAEMKENVQRKMILTNSLYRAIQRRELFLHYQPQVNLESGEIVGVEALLRWNHSEFGSIPPNTFIPIAERTGIINSIGEWVMKAACLQNKEWQDMGLTHIRISVNASVVQLRNPGFACQVRRILEETNLDPSYLEIEITESAAVKEAVYIIDVLQELKKIGVSISIDDFGTQYSSLSRLKLLPVDRIKMDIQFVQGIEGNEKDKAIAVAIINLAKSLELNVVAEGVETSKQHEFLKQRRCEEVQGYYYYKPVPAKEIKNLLKNKYL